MKTPAMTDLNLLTIPLSLLASKLGPGYGRLTFAMGKPGLDAAKRILDVNNSEEGPMPKVSLDQESRLKDAIKWGTWNNIGTREVTISGLAKAKPEFLDSLAPGWEKIKADPHSLEKLVTTKAGKRQEVADKLLRFILTPDIRREFSNVYDASITGQLKMIDGIPALEFLISDIESKKALLTLAVCGFSGRGLVDGVLGGKQLCELKDIRGWIRMSMANYRQVVDGSAREVEADAVGVVA